MDERCAREGCDKIIPKAARIAGDPYCSNVCCRIDHGLDPVRDGHVAHRNQVCAGCGCAMDERTPDCRACIQRHANRVKAGTARMV